MKKHPVDNGIYYFLGNITSHITHAIPLYEKLGGTFVVTSARAAKEMDRYNVPFIQIDDVNLSLQKNIERVRAKLGLSSYALRLGKSVEKTFLYLEHNAKVVLFYELFEFTKYTKLSGPRTLFLTHGNMLKDYFGMYPRRKEIIKQYDYMAGLGPLLKRDFIQRHHIPSGKFVDIGVARTDELHNLKSNKDLRKRIASAVGFSEKKLIVSYFTTFWGPSSIYNTAKEILRNVDDSFIILFQLHPQVPDDIKREYEEIVKNKKNVFLVDSVSYPSLDLPSLLCVSDIILGDVSSVILEAILVDRPMVFVYDKDEHRQKDSDYRMIKEVVKWSEYIDMGNVVNTNKILLQAYERGVNKKIWKQTKDDTFYHHDGTSVATIVDFVKSLK